MLQPRRILCLGKPCREKMRKTVPFKELIANELYVGVLRDSVVYAMPHPSKPNWSDAEKEMVGSCLGYLFHAEDIDSVTSELIRAEFGDKIEAWENRRSAPVCKVDFEQLRTKIVERFGTSFDDAPKTFRCDFTQDTALTVTRTGGGYVGIRAQRGAGKAWNGDLANRDAFARILLGVNGWESEKQWLATKRLNRIGSVEGFIEELSAIEERFSQLGR